MKKILVALFLIFNFTIVFASIQQSDVNNYVNDYGLSALQNWIEENDTDPNITITSYEKTLLMWAAERGNVNFLNYLISKGGNVNRLDAEGDSILYYAKKDSSTLSTLLENGMDVSFKDSNYKDIIDIAIDMNDLSLIETAIDKGYDKDAVLIKGINLNNSDLITLALNKGANPNQSITVDDKETRLIIYAYEQLKNNDIVNLLISKGANIDEEGFSLVDKAMLNKDLVLLKSLIEKEIDVNMLREIGTSEKITLLFYMIALNDIDNAKLLISKNANILQENTDKTSPFDLILANNMTDIFKLALEMGLDPNVTYKGKPLIHHIANSNSIELMEILINKGVHVNERDTEGKTALMIAASMNNIEMVRKLVANGADISIKDNSGRKAYDYTDYPEIKDILKNNMTLYFIIGGVIAFIISMLLVLNKRKKRTKTNEEVVFPQNAPGTSIIEEIYNFLNPNRKELKVTMKNEKVKISSKTRVCYIHINEYKEIVCKEKIFKPMLILMSFIMVLIAIFMVIFGDNQYMVNKPFTYFAIAFVPGIMNPILKNRVEILLIKYSEKKYNFDISEAVVDINLFNLINKSSRQNKGIIKQIEELIKQGANINARDYEGNTPLMRAISKGNTEIAKLFLDKGVAVNCKNFRGETALNLATKLGRVEIAKELMDRKVNIEVEDVAFEMPNYR